MEKHIRLCAVVLIVLLISSSALAIPFMYGWKSCDDWDQKKTHKNSMGLRIVEREGEDDEGDDDWDIGLCSTRQYNNPSKKVKQNEWVNGADVAFALTFTKATGTIEFQIGDLEPISRVYPEYAGKGMDEIYIGSNSYAFDSVWTYCFMTNLKLNGESYDFQDIWGNKIHTYATIGGLDCGDFVLTGLINCNWIGKFPRDKEKKRQFEFRLGEPCEQEEPPIDKPVIDLDGDCVVNFVDFEILASYWLESCPQFGDCQGADFDYNHEVNLNDLVLMSQEWLSKKFGGGCGREGNPYLIYTAQQLHAIGAEPNEWGAHFRLMANIDLGDHTGNSFNTIGSPEVPFTGVFDGNNLTISYFTQGDNGQNCIGFFRVIDSPNSVVKDLTLLYPTLETEGPYYAGSLVGMLNSGTVLNCHVKSGELFGYGGLALTTGANYVGGLVGYSAGTIYQCSVDCDMTGYDMAGGLVGCNQGTIEKCFSVGTTITGHDRVGGLVGLNNMGTILDSYSRKDIFAHDQVGGLVGECNDGQVQFCYSTGHVMENSDDRGGLVGLLVGDLASVNDSFWDIDTGGVLNDNFIGTPKNTPAMKMQTTFASAGWDFATPVWRVYENIEYPLFWWYVTPGPNPMTWEVAPQALSPYVVTMTATTAASYDNSEVEYYFENISDANHSSGWQSGVTFTDADLVPNTQYSYRVKAGDNSPGFNETDFSEIAVVTTPDDVTAPEPNPLRWMFLPRVTGPFSVELGVREVSDEGGVEYYFFNLTDPNHDSGWQESNFYEDTGLDDLTEYTYQAVARDKSPNQNQTEPVKALTVTTQDGTAPEPDPIGWAMAPDPNGAHEIVMAAADACDPSGVQYYFNNVTDPTHDSGWQDSPVYFDTGLPERMSFTYQVKTRDVSCNYNQGQYSGQASAMTGPDNSAPAPDPMTFESAPQASGPHSIIMTATSAFDVSGVEYYFECTDGNGHDSNWQDSPIYRDTELELNTQYAYRVKARDKSLNQNETAYSGEFAAITEPDTTPPTPDPMTWESEPAMVSYSSIVMTASIATDDEGWDVEYYFHNVTDSNHDSGWQSGTAYEDTNLMPLTEYTYVVKARDNSPNFNETAYSVTASAVTDSATPRTDMVETFYSLGNIDGRLWRDQMGETGYEADDATNYGLRLGDYGKYGYKCILSFPTETLPEDSEMVSATLELTRAGTPDDFVDPFIWGGDCVVDIASAYFGMSLNLESQDWDAAAGAGNIAVFVGAPGDPGADMPMTSTEFSAEGLANISTETGTQFRVGFTNRINYPNDVDADFLGFYGGEYEVVNYRPKLTISYTTRSPLTLFNSIGDEDGRVWNVNGGLTGIGANTSETGRYGLRLGDFEDAGGAYGYKNILTFDTSILPDDAEIVSARLEMTRGYFGPEQEPPVDATDPFAWAGACVVDIATPAFGNPAIEPNDFQAQADATSVAAFSADPGLEMAMVSTYFDSGALQHISKTDKTQLRVYFVLPTNINGKSDFLGFYPGGAQAEQDMKAPRLIIRYKVR